MSDRSHTEAMKQPKTATHESFKQGSAFISLEGAWWVPVLQVNTDKRGREALEALLSTYSG